MNNYQQNIMNKYLATNRIAFYHPRKKTISLNGGRELPINEAINQMMDCLMSSDNTHNHNSDIDSKQAFDFMKTKTGSNDL